MKTRGGIEVRVGQIWRRPRGKIFLRVEELFGDKVEVCPLSGMPQRVSIADDLSQWTLVRDVSPDRGGRLVMPADGLRTSDR